MTYEITTANAASFIKTVLDCVENSTDQRDNRIDTWDVYKQDDIRYLIHTTNQWEDKGCIKLVVKENSNNRIVKASFLYFRGFAQDQRSGNEADYYLGRLTELMLVHFKGLFDSISIY